MKKICVLLAVYNGANWLEIQINSIINQLHLDVYIYISIDLSTDKSLDLVQQLSVKFPNINILPCGIKYGDAAANFFRLLHDTNFSEFNYISFSDQDDIWNENKLSRAVAELQRADADGYSSSITAFWPNGKIKLIDKAQPQVQWDCLFESAGPGCTFVLTKPLAIKIQEFVRAHPQEMQIVWLHDWFMYAFARANGYKWTIDSQSTMQYRQHAHNVVGVNLGFKALKHRAKFILQGEWFKQVALLAKLVGKQDSDFVKSWLPFSRVGFLKLAFQANKCRRKRSEQVWFFFICLLMAVRGHKANSK